MRNTKTLVALAGLVALPWAASASVVIQASSVPFVNIGVTGTNIAGIGDDTEIDITGAALTGAGFNGNGLLAGGVNVRVGNNGAVIWNPSGTMEIGWANPNSTNTVNPSIAGASATIAISDSVNGNGHSTTAGGSRQLLAVLWDDNFPSSTAPATTIKWQVIAGDLIVQWSDEDHFNATGTGRVTYEMIVRGGVSIASGLPLVDYVYQDTNYAANQYQNDGGSASIGYKDWGVNPNANDVEFGVSGGSGNTTTDPAFGGVNMNPKVAGYADAGNPNLTHSVTILGVPAPGSLALLGLGGLIAGRRRRA